MRRLAARLAFVLALLTGELARGADDPPRLDPASGGLPAGLELQAERMEQTGPDSFRLEGAVTLKWRGSRIQADRVEIRSGKDVLAEGDVLVVWEGNRISGDSMTYDLDTERGTVQNVAGFVPPYFYFRAKSAEKIGAKEIHLEQADVTTCTQPLPYWSFSVSSADLTLGAYAHLWNVRFRTGRAAIVYLPYVMWPIKKDRAVGLLLPQFGNTRNRGRVYSLPLFIPVGASANLTLYGEYYSVGAVGGGGELEVIPNRQGTASLSGFYIQDPLMGLGRYRTSYRQTQSFENGFRMLADVEQVSDADYYADFERDIRLVSTPQILARVEFSRNGPWTSVNVRELRREQLQGGDLNKVQKTLPEIEWRGRSKRLGRTPLYLTYEASLANIQQRDPLARFYADYRRGDFYPTLSLPISPVPWLDINPSITYRASYYTQSRDPGNRQVREDDLFRSAFGGGMEVVGPKFFRIFERPDGRFSKRYKHSFEPVLSYGYQQAFERSSEIIVYDDVDAAIVLASRLSYALRTRLFAQRPRSKSSASAPSEESPPTEAAEADVLTAGGEQAPEEEATAEPAPLEPIEIASLEIRQSRSLVSGPKTPQIEHPPITVSGRFNPNPLTSLDLRATYDSVADRVSSVGLSGGIRGDIARVGFAFQHQPGIPSVGQRQNSLRLGTGVVLFDGRFRLDVDGSYVANPTGATSHIPDQRWRMEFYTQCCGLLAEFFERRFVGSPRREFRFAIDLRGIGKLFDWHAEAGP